MKMPKGWPTPKMREVGNQLAASYGIHSAMLVFEAMLTAAPEQDNVEEMRQRKDRAYEERNRVVAFLARLFPSGVARTAIGGWSEDWHGCVYIDLPTGQISWHFHDSHAHLFEGLPQYTKSWDGHSTEQKYELLDELCISDELVVIPKNLSYPLTNYDIRALAHLCGFTLKANNGTDLHPYVYVFARGLLAVNQNEVETLRDRLRQLKKDFDLLSEAVIKSAVKAGVVRPDVNLTASSLSELCNHLVDIEAKKFTASDQEIIKLYDEEMAKGGSANSVVLRTCKAAINFYARANDDKKLKQVIREIAAWERFGTGDLETLRELIKLLSSMATDSITLPQESCITGDDLEAAYWDFDARQKGYGEYEGCSNTERYNFKMSISRIMRDKLSSNSDKY